MGNKFKILYVAFVSLVLGVLFYNHTPTITIDWIVFILFLIGFAIDSILPVCIYVVCNLFGVSYDVSFQVWVNYAVILYVGVKCVLEFRQATLDRILKYLLILLVSMIISFFFGEYSNFKLLVNVVVLFLVFLTFSSTKYQGKQSLLIASLFSAGIVISLYAAIQFFTGQMELISTVKLNYNENVRNLSNALVFPFFFSGYKLIDNSGKRNKEFILWLLSFCFTGILLVLSYSRGAILSSFIAIAVIFLLNLKSKSFGRIIFVVAVLLLFYNILGSLDVDSEKMYSDESALDRFDFWGFMFLKMCKKPLCLLFGFGPCNILEVTGNTIFEGYYSHSVFLDFLFLYGIVGFVAFLSFLIFITKRVFSKKQPFNIGLLALCFLMFTSHGSSFTIQFYAFLGLCSSCLIEQEQ